MTHYCTFYECKLKTFGTKSKASKWCKCERNWETRARQTQKCYMAFNLKFIFSPSVVFCTTQRLQKFTWEMVSKRMCQSNKIRKGRVFHSFLISLSKSKKYFFGYTLELHEKKLHRTMFVNTQYLILRSKHTNVLFHWPFYKTIYKIPKYSTL